MLVELENGDKIVIEMNVNRFYDKIKIRNLIYLSKILSGEYKVGDKDLSGVHKVIQINFNTKPSKFNGMDLEKLINEFEIIEKDNLKIKYSDIVKIIVVDMEKASDKSYNYLDEREEKIGQLCRMLMVDTIDGIRKEGKEIMDDRTLNHLVKQVKKLSSDEAMIELEGHIFEARTRTHSGD